MLNNDEFTYVLILCARAVYFCSSQLSRLVTLTRADDAAAGAAASTGVMLLAAASVAADVELSGSETGAGAVETTEAESDVAGTSVEGDVAATAVVEAPNAVVLVLRERVGEASLLVVVGVPPPPRPSFSFPSRPGEADEAALADLGVTIFSFFLTSCRISSSLAAIFAMSVWLFLIRFFDAISLFVYGTSDAGLATA